MVIVLPHSCVGQIMKAVDELLCGVQECEEGAECVGEVEILIGEGVEKKVEDSEFDDRTVQYINNKADELLPEAIADTESVNIGDRNSEQALVLGVEAGCNNEGAPSDSNRNLLVMKDVKNEISESSDDQEDSKQQAPLQPIHFVNNQPNPTCPPNSTGQVQVRLHQSSLKPHRCTTCGKGFVSRSNMKAHMRLHEGTALR